MLQINGKTFMNLQEAVQWLLDNNALPFQSSANYVANTEIGMGTIVNPSPAKVRIGSLIFFADSKVSTVIGLTENGFIVSDQYNNLVDDVAHVTNVAINASGHLITTMSDGQTIDAGIIKQVSSFSINASQHLIANYNDGTSTDLGAIFTGNLNISGDVIVTGKVSQATPNYSIPVNFSSGTGLDITNIYNRLEVINNVLYVIVNVKLTNNSGSPITVTAGNNIIVQTPLLDNSVAQKIIDLEGNSAAESSVTNNAIICAVPALISDSLEETSGHLFINGKLVVANRTAANACRITVGANTNVTVNDGDNIYITARMILTLI